MQREEEEKRHIYETQEYSRADVERINRNKLQLKGNIELLEGENADFDQQIWEKEIQITKEQEKVQYYQRKQVNYIKTYLREKFDTYIKSRDDWLSYFSQSASFAFTCLFI